MNHSGQHCRACEIYFTDCLCTRCKRDKLADPKPCCASSMNRINPDGNTCGIAKCENYEPEVEEQGVDRK